MSNIIELLKDTLSPQLLSDVASTTGESSEDISTAFGGFFPVLLGSILKKSQAPDALEHIFNLLKFTPGLDTITATSTSLVRSLAENKELANAGEQFLKTALGDKIQNITSLLTNFAGIKGSSASTLISVAAPVVMGVLSKKITENGLSSASFLSFLDNHANNIISATPASFGSVLGIDDLNGVVQQVSDAGEKTGNEVTQRKSLFKPILACLALLLAALLAWVFHTPRVDTTALNNISDNLHGNRQDTVRNITDSTSGVPSPLGNSFQKLLPDGVELKISRFGFENKLLTAIEDPAYTIEKKVWLSFDRLNFESGSAILKSDSHKQLKNIADILIAYPKVTLKLGGYTDNTGTPEENLKLSQQRAYSVRNALIDMGVNGVQLQLEGYGQENPVASNDTAEGREKNRRIDAIIVTK
ncbi:hypothetical protein BSQ98_24865 [Serratia liquefaciens]|uniref:OmpA family protein n=1 Tax=Serratia TaxID=613 RepID=UPI001021A31C|nr:OmpA family protein [Serratia liquefaciens]RYM58194.1 hypothetical protein BSQ98_24865 [Serratia liquefaciens]